MQKMLVVLLMSLLSSSLFAQTDLTGSWDTGKENTIVKIFEKEDGYVGEIISSDKSEEAIGKQIVKDVKKDDDAWKGKLYVAKKKKWLDATFSPEGEILKIKVKAGFMSKTVEWKKVIAKPEAEKSETKTEEKKSETEEGKTESEEKEPVKGEE